MANEFRKHDSLGGAKHGMPGTGVAETFSVKETRIMKYSLRMIYKSRDALDRKRI